MPDDPFTLLRKFSMLKDDQKLTFAASLLFCAKPPANTAIHAVRFKGTDKAESVEDLGIIENIGSGLKQVCGLLAKENHPLPFFEGFASGTRVVVCSEYTERYTEKYTVKYPEKYPVNISKSEASVLRLVGSAPQSTRAEIASKIGLSLPAIKKILSGLKKKDLLRRIGPDKGGHWEVINK